MPSLRIPSFSNRPVYQLVSSPCLSPSIEISPSGSCSDKEALSDQEYSAVCQSRWSCVFFRIGFWLLLFTCIFEFFIIGLNSSAPAFTARISTKSPVPPIPQILKTFYNDLSMLGLKTKQDVETAWKILDTPHAGFVQLLEPQTYSLRQNKNVIPGAENVYMISAYHQLHCLKELHLAFITIANVRLPMVERRHGDHEHGQIKNDSMIAQHPEMSLKHAEHCFAYLRQGIMCAGDTTLEGPDPGGRTLQGWGTRHQCRQWEGTEGVEGWAKKHMVP